MIGGHLKVAIALVIIACATLCAPYKAFDPQEAEYSPEAVIEAPEQDNATSEDSTPIQDPCGLDSVVCEGEEKASIWILRTVTAYTSTVAQTDDTPCIAADGTDICERYAQGESICAANFVPLGTILLLDTSDTPDGEDAIVCVVADRMGSAHPEDVDLYMGDDLPRALEFGKQDLFVRTFDL